MDFPWTRSPDAGRGVPPERPDPARYGLNAANVARFEQCAEHLEPALAFGCMGLCALGAVVWAALYSEDVLLFLVVALFAGSIAGGVGLLGGFLAMAGLNALEEHVGPTARAWRRYEKDLATYEAAELRRREEFWLGMTGRQFEVEMARLFVEQGYSAELTPPSGDQGIDIVLKRGPEHVVVQCKATSKPVGPSVVRDLFGAMTANHADRAILATIAGVTTGARAFVKGKPITVISLREIIHMQRQVQASKAVPGS